MAAVVQRNTTQDDVVVAHCDRRINSSERRTPMTGPRPDPLPARPTGVGVVYRTVLTLDLVPSALQPNLETAVIVRVQVLHLPRVVHDHVVHAHDVETRVMTASNSKTLQVVPDAPSAGDDHQSPGVTAHHLLRVAHSGQPEEVEVLHGRFLPFRFAMSVLQGGRPPPLSDATGRRREPCTTPPSRSGGARLSMKVDSV